MLFNSIEFLIFLIIVFVLYWFVFKKTKQQNILILLASYIFYGWWDWRFLSLIFLSTLVDFSIGKYLEITDEKRKRKWALGLSLFFNLGMLGFFKYYNFFIENFVIGFQQLGIQMNVSSLQIILPVGISFYTFQTLSYTIDVYQKKLTPSNNFVSFASFVSFFPQLVAGPIERATNLLPQFHKERKFDYNYAVSGMKLILWGLVKKVVIADNCAVYVNQIFDNYQEQSGLTLIIGAVFFAFQIYGDFSGYSDIAIGTARLFGFDLMRNFKYPYFSRDIAEFWRNWHISLTTWFRDYVYIPLGGSKGSKTFQLRNVFIIFLVSGFWHGANWTFIAWGIINALLFVPLLLTNRNRKNIDVNHKNTSIKDILSIIATFSVTCLAWVFFRAETITEAIQYIGSIFDISNFLPSVIRQKRMFPVLFIFILIEWLSRRDEIVVVFKNKFRYVFYILFIFMILYYSSDSNKTSFIYFQF
ncbi:MBOAT family protein [Polaribacter sp. R2A056_3_33]|uniref:MBOAT family O-acyltransferase n=1 Tax=Polaribacter sp. R2A056_3_33 TaxID=2745563 RepID=UPI001C4E5C52|nr:MBOAT family O-acyltransferase [Polaribacter sp. R2A056_3_33]QXP69642.1 MBOAT family protein [Polaribacter sp. R2A056_3_33]